MIFYLRLPALLSAAALLTSCATTISVRDCAPGEERAIVDSLYFGTNMPGGQVGRDDWQSFLATVITPRFPKGVTTWSASGQWQRASGHIEKEGSYVLQVVHPDSRQADKDLEEIVSLYKKRFRQEAVLRIRNSACVSL